MPRPVTLIAALVALTPVPALADAPAFGHYRVSEGPDVAGELAIGKDGTFTYWLVAGALDERSQGQWHAERDKICLATSPKPVPPQFTQAPNESALEQTATIFVSWPNGEGIAGIDFRIGFDNGEVLEEYTQYDGWTLPDDHHRTPVWAELSLPMHGVSSPRFALNDGALHAVLTPNDLGTIDLTGACLEQGSDGAILRRADGSLHVAHIAE